MATTEMCATDYAEERIAAYIGTWTFYVALMSVGGGETKSAGTEFDAVDYARQSLTFVVDVTDASKLTNSGGNIAFGTPATDWGDAAEVRLYDQATGGEDLYYFTLSPVVACDAGAPVLIPLGQLTLTVK